MFLVQVVAQRYLPKDATTGRSEFGVFMALMNALAQMAIPALGLQTVFAQQTGAATTDQRRRELAGTVRGVINLLFILWLVVVVLAQVFEQRLLVTYKIQNPTALWFTIDAALLAMISPIFGGVPAGPSGFPLVRMDLDLQRAREIPGGGHADRAAALSGSGCDGRRVGGHDTFHGALHVAHTITLARRDGAHCMETVGQARDTADGGIGRVHLHAHARPDRGAAGLCGQQRLQRRAGGGRRVGFLDRAAGGGPLPKGGP